MILGVQLKPHFYGCLRTHGQLYYSRRGDDNLSHLESDKDFKLLDDEFLPYFGRQTNCKIFKDSIDPYSDLDFMPRPWDFAEVLLDQGARELLGEEVHFELSLVYPEESKVSVVGNFEELKIDNPNGGGTSSRLVGLDGAEIPLMAILYQNKLMQGNVRIQAFSVEQQKPITAVTTMRPSGSQIYLQTSKSLRSISDILLEKAEEGLIDRKQMTLVFEPTDQHELEDA